LRGKIGHDHFLACTTAARHNSQQQHQLPGSKTTAVTPASSAPEVDPLPLAHQPEDPRAAITFERGDLVGEHPRSGQASCTSGAGDGPSRSTIGRLSRPLSLGRQTSWVHRHPPSRNLGITTPKSSLASSHAGVIKAAAGWLEPCATGCEASGSGRPLRKAHDVCHENAGSGRRRHMMPTDPRGTAVAQEQRRSGRGV